MANGLKDGFTRIAHKIMEDIMKYDFSKREYKILLWVLRNGYGFSHEQSACKLNVNEIANDTHIDRSHVWKTLHLLEKKNVLVLEKKEIRFIRHSAKWAMAKTATNNVRLKQPQIMAKTATKHGQYSLEHSDNTLTNSDLPPSKERLNKIETPISPEKGDCVPPNLAKATEQIIAFLNLETGKAFKLSTKGTQRLIKARLSEGFTVEDFNKVIKVKSEQWKDDKKMDGYLRPQTLFGPKFEGYLQEYAKTTTAQTAYGF